MSDDDYQTDESLARDMEKLGLEYKPSGATKPDETKNNVRKLFGDDVVHSKAAPTVIDTRDGIVAELNARGYGTVFKDDKFKVVYIDRYGVIHFYTKKDFVDSMAKEKMLVTETSPTGVITGKNKPVSLYWLEHDKHKEYEKVIFDPSREHSLNDRDLNLFPGFAFKPKKGQCYKTLMYIRDVICNGDKDVYRWLMAWSAHIFQNPREKPETAVAIQGEEEGTGKSFFPHIISRLLDKQNMGITQRLYFKASNSKMITGDFSGHLEHCLVLHAEEAFSAESNKEDSIIKDLISGDEIGINAKNIEAKLSRNYIRLILTGNPPHIVKVSRFARRFLVLKISAKHALDTDYFRELSDELVTGGYEALMYYFMHYPIYKYNLRIVKKTKALLEQTIQSMSHEERFWYNILCMGELPFVDPDVKYDPSKFNEIVNHAKSIPDAPTKEHHSYYVLKRKLSNKFQSFIGKRVGRNKSDETSFGMQFNRFFPQLNDKNELIKDREGRMINSLRDEQKGQLWYYVIPTLRVCRLMFEAHLGQKCEWPDNISLWTIEKYDLF